VENLAVLLFGLLLGSFANVCIARMPRRRSIVHPGSACPSCGAKIRWYDNVPVLSWILLRGKCRDCKAPISARYPVVEMLCALLFLSAKLRFGFSWTLVLRDWPLLFSFLVVTFIDLRHRIIPDIFSIGGTLLALATAGLPEANGWGPAFLGASVGFGVFYGFAWLYEKMTGRSGLGGGDVKLLALIGAFLGVQGVFSTILISSVLGSIVGIAWGFLSGRKRVMRVAIPYGPFLVLGALVEYFFGEVLWLLYKTPM
jgi:leader peptidase (prepilin peptidase)/N-methyltransferase